MDVLPYVRVPALSNIVTLVQTTVLAAPLVYSTLFYPLDRQIETE